MTKIHPSPQQSLHDWRVVATQVLRGDWKRLTESEAEALATGLRGYASVPSCAEALEVVDPKKKYRYKEVELKGLT